MTYIATVNRNIILTNGKRLELRKDTEVKTSTYNKLTDAQKLNYTVKKEPMRSNYTKDEYTILAETYHEFAHLKGIESCILMARQAGLKRHTDASLRQSFAQCQQCDTLAEQDGHSSVASGLRNALTLISRTRYN